MYIKHIMLSVMIILALIVAFVGIFCYFLPGIIDRDKSRVINGLMLFSMTLLCFCYMDWVSSGVIA